MLNQNSFQKNAFVNVNNSNKQVVNNDPNKLGRMTVDEVKQNMLDVKHKEFLERKNANNKEVEVKSDNLHRPANYQERINNLRNIKRG